MSEEATNPPARKMSNPWPFQDRRAMFQPGREVHQPSKPRRPSGSGTGGVTEAVRRASVTSNDGLDRTATNTSTSSAASPPPGRRKSSTSGGMFGNLTNYKRGSEDYGERRTSYGDAAGGGVLSGWYNKTFKGMGGPQGSAGSGSAIQEERRGVMENKDDNSVGRSIQEQVTQQRPKAIGRSDRAKMSMDEIKESWINSL